MFDDFALELHPTDEQRARLQDFLVEVKALSRKYQMLIANVAGDDGQATPMVLDLERNSIVGVDFGIILDPERADVVQAYWCEDSILDGVWLVERDDGSWVEQRYWHRDPARSSRPATDTTRANPS